MRLTTLVLQVQGRGWGGGGVFSCFRAAALWPSSRSHEGAATSDVALLSCVCCRANTYPSNGQGVWVGPNHRQSRGRQHAQLLVLRFLEQGEVRVSIVCLFVFVTVCSRQGEDTRRHGREGYYLGGAEQSPRGPSNNNQPSHTELTAMKHTRAGQAGFGSCCSCSLLVKRGRREGAGGFFLFLPVGQACVRRQAALLRAAGGGGGEMGVAGGRGGEGADNSRDGTE